MEPENILKLVELLSREKNLEKEVVFEALEHAMLTAARKKVDDPDNIGVHIERHSGHIQLSGEAQNFDINSLGRIAAQTAKQVIIQKVREAERDQIFEEFHNKIGEIVVGTVQRIEGRGDKPNLVINIGGRTEAYFPRSEQIFDEHFNIGDRVRGVLTEVRKAHQKVKLIVSRAHPQFVRKLFELEVPEIADRIIEIKAIEREAGHRSKVAVASYDSKVDCVGACVGQRGTRIKGIIDELNGEKIDIVRWNDSPEILIQNALKPARIASITLDYDRRKARIVVPDDQLSLAIGKRGQNVRLGARLCRWDFNIITESQEAEWRTRTIAKFMEIPNMTSELAYKVFDSGFDSFGDINDAGPEPLMAIPDMDVELAAKIIQHVQDHPDSSLTVDDAVNANGAFRLDGGGYLEPGQLRPGEIPLEMRVSIESDSESGSESNMTFDSLFGGGGNDAKSDEEAATAAQNRRFVRLGDIFEGDKGDDFE